MAYTTRYTLKRFDATTSIMYVVVDILNDATTPAVVETISSFPIKLSIDATGAVPQGSALDTHIINVLNSVFDGVYLEQRKNQYDNGGITNASLIYTLTLEEEANETVPKVIGFVFDTTGAPVDGVTVTSSNGQTATTDITGGFLFDATSGAQKVSASKTGYFNNFKMITVGGLTNVNLVLLEETGYGSSVSLTGLTSGTVTGTGTGRPSNNAEVDFPANAIVDGSNNPVTDATLKIGNIVVSDPSAVDVFPGTFLGNVSGSNDPIESYGYINLSVEDGSGNSLSLDPAIGATVRMPVDPDPVGQNTIATWRLNETTGIWEQGANATRVGNTNVFEFTTTTFSWLNIDVPLTETCTLTVTAYINKYDYNTGQVIGVLKASKGVDVFVDVTASAWGRPTLWQGRGTTDANGQVTLKVPPGYMNVYGKKGLVSYGGVMYETSGTSGACLATMPIYADATVPPSFPQPAPLSITAPEFMTLNVPINLTWQGGGTLNQIKVDILDPATEVPTTTTILADSILVSGSVSFTPTQSRVHIFYIEATDGAGNVTTAYSANNYITPQ